MIFVSVTMIMTFRFVGMKIADQIPSKKHQNGHKNSLDNMNATCTTASLESESEFINDRRKDLDETL